MMLKALLVLLALFFVFGPAVSTPYPAFAEDEAEEGEEEGDGEAAEEEEKPPPDIDIKGLKDALKKAEAEERIKLIEAAAVAPNAKGDKDAHKAVVKYTSDRNQDVAVAAIKAIGQIQAKSGLKTLMGLSDPKKMKKQPGKLAAALWALRFYGSEKDKKTRIHLYEVAKKWITKQPTKVAESACESLGFFPQRESIENLIELMALTYPKAGQGGSISTEYRDRLKAMRPSMIGALQELTGWDFGDAKAWNNFWMVESKTWTPEHKIADPKSMKSWSDPGYGFTIELPADDWFFDRIPLTRVQLRWDKPPTGKKDKPLHFAAINISAYDATAYPGTTAKSRAAEREKWYRDNWNDIKDDKVDHDHDFVIGKADKKLREKIDGTKQEFTGRDRAGNIMKVVNIYILHEGMMFTLGAWRKSGSPPRIEVEIMKAIDTFRFMAHGKKKKK